MSADGEIPDRMLASALDFAIGIAAAGARERPALRSPVKLRRFFESKRLSDRDLKQVRAIVEADPEFRERVGSAATLELVDEVGLVWLRRPEGWPERLIELVGADGSTAPASASASASASNEARLRAAERRREAAEQAATRAIAELAAVRSELERRITKVDRTAAAADAARSELEAMRDDLRAVRSDLRHTTDRLLAAQERLERTRADLDAANARTLEAERVRDRVLSDRASVEIHRPESRQGIEAAAEVILADARRVAATVAGQADVARRLLGDLERAAADIAALEPVVRRQVVRPANDDPARRPRSAGRRPVSLPGGLYSSSPEVAEFLVKIAGMQVLIDGYNVAKLGWPALDLAAQREQCIASAEDVARRFGTAIQIVFDGASVAGAVAPGRRLVRVQFSPEGVTADDVLRAETDRLPVVTPVTVVTNDQAIVADVKAMGAHVLSSEQWLVVSRRRS